MDTYLTIKQAVREIIYKEKGSKFLGYAFPVSTLEEIKDIVNQLKKEHPTARHHCYAYRIGYENTMQYRANDDGEPNGTAGIPIYNQIISKDLTNVLVVSVRYFGGIKLGVSGLIKAYKTNAKETLEACEIEEKIVEELVKVHFEYAQLSEVMRICKIMEVNILQQNFEESCELVVSLRKKNVATFSKELQLLKNVIVDTNQ